MAAEEVVLDDKPPGVALELNHLRRGAHAVDRGALAHPARAARHAARVAEEEVVPHEVRHVARRRPEARRHAPPDVVDENDLARVEVGE